MTTVTKLPLKCSICGEEIRSHPLSGWAYGNNAEPINSGRCCDSCDSTVVIPTRIRMFYAQREKR